MEKVRDDIESVRIGLGGGTLSLHELLTDGETGDVSLVDEPLFGSTGGGGPLVGEEVDEEMEELRVGLAGGFIS